MHAILWGREREDKHRQFFTSPTTPSHHGIHNISQRSTVRVSRALHTHTRGRGLTLVVVVVVLRLLEQREAACSSRLLALRLLEQRERVGLLVAVSPRRAPSSASAMAHCARLRDRVERGEVGGQSGRRHRRRQVLGGAQAIKAVYGDASPRA